jgi:hypothetical protein
MYEWYLSILDDGDQEVIRFLRSTGEEHMANMPTSRGGSTRIANSDAERLAYLTKFATPSEMMSGGTRSKWERIGKPLFTPSIEMVMYFTPMNPFVYRTLRAIQLGHDASQGVDYD